MKYKIRLSSLIFFLIIALAGCKLRAKKELAFYYWRTTFRLDSTEKNTLINNGVSHIYVRYFDIDFETSDIGPQPLAIIQFDSPPSDYNISPVIYIKNRVFEKLDIDSLSGFSKNVYRLIQSINHLNQISNTEVQFDCDWTEKTRDKYFMFLRLFRQLGTGAITSTIRLHQIKYPARMGVPPVDRGILMFYNMGNINAGYDNSVYDKAISEKYSPSIKTYPLALDLALPIFTWALHLRNGKVIQLLNKISFTHFENDSNFTALSESRYIARRPAFLGGYYFQSQDSVKIEHVSEFDILGIVDQVNRFSNGRIGNLIFYDLDRRNLNLYEENIFKKVRDRAD